MAVEKDSTSRGIDTLDSIIRGALMDIGADLSRYEQFLHWGLEVFKWIHMDIYQEVKTVELSLTTWKALQTPTDYLDWTKIGVRVNGVIRLFTNDDNIALAFDDVDVDGFPDANQVASTFDPTQVDVTNAFVPQQLYFWGLTSRGEDAGQLYGLTVKGNGTGYFRENKERQEIQFAPTVPASTKIYLEYIANGYNPNKKTMVHSYASLAIKLYIHWQRVKFSKSSSLGEVADFKRDFYAELERVVARMNPITVADILEVQRDAYRLTPYF